MQDIENKIRQVIAPIVEEEAVDLVDLEIRGTKSNPIIRVFVDVPGGISIDRCVRLSREFENAIELQNPTLKRYRLEVSSPGIDRPLKTARDFERNLGRLVKVRFLEGEQVRSLQGEIAEVNAQRLVLKTASEEMVPIPLAAIQKALIQIRW